MAFLELQAAATWTGIISARLENHMGDLTRFHVVHNVGRSPAQTEFIGHKPHWPINVPEELPVARTKIIKPRFTFWCFDKTVLRAFAVAGESDLTLEAIFGQSIELIPAELSLLPGIGQICHALISNISEKEPGLHKMIAGVHVSIVLHSHGRPTGLREGTDPRRYPCPGGKSYIEDLDKDPTYISLAPNHQRYLSKNGHTARPSQSDP